MLAYTLNITRANNWKFIKDYNIILEYFVMLGKD